MSREGVPRGPRLRATPSPALFAALRDRYEIGDGTERGTRDLGGSSNLNLLATGIRSANRNESSATRQYGVGSQDCWVVRVYRPWVTSQRLDAIQSVRRTLADGGVPCAPPCVTLDGASWITVQDRLVEVEPYVPHDAEMDTWERLHAGLPLLGRIHALLESLRPGEAGRSAPASNNISPKHLLRGVQLGTQRIREWPPTDAERHIADLADTLATLVAGAEHRQAGPLHRQLVHGDFWDNNVLFRAGQIVQITDLDFMGERARIDDLALTLYYTNSTFKDDQTSPRRAQALRALVDAYDSGLDACGVRPLSGAERAALPAAIARTTLGFIAMIPAVDSEPGARKLAAEMARDLSWAHAMMQDLAMWQFAFTA
jgi:Ser/Thr protein kinase RdoA (MazF antagonist)